MNIQLFLLKKIQKILKTIQLESFLNSIYIQKTTKKEFGNYQINGLIAIAKKINIPAEKLAEKIIQSLYLHDIAEIIKIEKPGFINIFLKPQWISNQINRITSKNRLDISKIQQKQNIIIDYSSPNIAKEMHVGHLRSTVIGDSMSHILSFLGYNVIRINHIGDWGTQFGMIIAYIKKYMPKKFLLNNITSLSTLEYIYKKAQLQYNVNSDFAQLSRNYVVKLQRGDLNQKYLWKNIVNISIENNQKLYKRLNINLHKCNIMGESFYNTMLPEIVKDLKAKGLATISNGATIVLMNNKNSRKNNTIPFGVIIQKKDGAYLYSTTDIACIKYRCNVLQADKIIYYIDSRQKQHLIQAKEIAEKAGYIKKKTSIEHHVCGMLLNKTGKPFKTRTGNTLKLITLLDEALKRARYIVYNKNPNLQLHEINELSHIISVGAIKYSELSKNRIINYIFSWEKILNFEGNTALYIQYAYTRIYSLLKNSQINIYKIKKNTVQLHTNEEIFLAICLLQFEETIVTVANRGTPHILCTYLYKLSVLFSCFYENCPIIMSNQISIKKSRLKLAFLTARILKKGLNLLGIKTTKYM